MQNYKEKANCLFSVMRTKREYIDINPAAANRVNHAVLISNAARPFATMIAFKRLGFSYTRKGMELNVIKQIGNAFHVCTLPVFTQKSQSSRAFFSSITSINILLLWG